MKMGEVQTLTVVKTVDFGVYLAEAPAGKASDTQVLLPQKQVPEGTRVGDTLDVFLYRDSEDRPIATTRTPRLTVGGVAALRVVQVSRIGAFLAWGLERDLFLPYREQLRKVKKGDEILVTLYVDKTGRLCATMRGLYGLLRTDSPHHPGETVTGRVYEFSRDFGTFVAVDDTYSAMIPKSEDTSDLRIGDVITATVTHVKPDGKLDITRRQKAAQQIDADAAAILALIEKNGGALPFTDKASPDVIMENAHMSKAAFKRAVGRLYKERKIDITDQEIVEIDFPKK